MALNRKGWRTLQLEDRPVYWKSRVIRNAPNSCAIEVCIVSGQAFRSGKTGQKLSIRLPRNSTVNATIVRYIVEHSPQFSGAAEATHVTASPGVVAQAAAMARPSRPFPSS